MNSCWNPFPCLLHITEDSINPAPHPLHGLSQPPGRSRPIPQCPMDLRQSPRMFLLSCSWKNPTVFLTPHLGELQSFPQLPHPSRSSVAGGAQALLVPEPRMQWTLPPTSTSPGQFTVPCKMSITACQPQSGRGFQGCERFSTWWGEMMSISPQCGVWGCAAAPLHPAYPIPSPLSARTPSF